VLLLFSALFISICGLLYELLISSVSSYFMGSSILHFSLTIGFFMSAMGVGSWVSKYFKTRLIEYFVSIEIALGLLGGLSGIVLYTAYAYSEQYYLVSTLLILLLGFGIGLEIPLLTRIVKQYATLREAVAQVLGFDYIGALIASLLFPLVLLPQFGAMRTSFLVGALNLAVALVCVLVFRVHLRGLYLFVVLSVGGLLGMGVGVWKSGELVGYYETSMYTDEIVLAEQTPYQRIVLTKNGSDFRLYLNGSLQFSTHDEHRYHEPLVHIPALLCPQLESALVLGGGDGIAVRELLKYPSLQRVTLVDLDPRMTELGTRNPLFRRINQSSLSDPRVRVRNQDAFEFLEHDTATYSLILIDLPDPHDAGLAKLYTREFYTLVKSRLSPGGFMSTQATSAYFAPSAYWCIAHTVGSVFGGRTLPYFTHVPTFGGVWGFVGAMASPRPQMAPPRPDSVAQGQGPFVVWARTRLGERLAHPPQGIRFRYLRPDKLDALFVPDPDYADRPTEVNSLESQPLVTYYNTAWEHWF
jgi:spermidine synthase